MKRFLILFLALFLQANNLTVISSNNYYTTSNVSQIYNRLLAYEETKKLIEIIDTFLNNEKFKKNLYIEEKGKVRVNTIDLLKQLKYFLEGWPKYSNTYFENNTDSAGVKKVLKDSIEDDANTINTPQNVINDMKKSILNLKFFEIANKIEDEVNKNPDNVKYIMKNFLLLLNSYVKVLSQSNIPFLTKYNENIKDKLERNYRIYAKANLIKIINIFDKLIKENYKRVESGL